MATLTPLAAGETTSTLNVTSYASNAFTPTAGRLLVIQVFGNGTIATDTTLVGSANGLTFAKAATDTSGGGRYDWWVANQLTPSTPVSMTVTWDCTSDPAGGVLIFPFELSGMTKVGMLAVRQFGISVGFSAAAAPIATLPAAALTSNPVVGLASNLSGPAGLTPPVGWTEGADSFFTTPTNGAEYAYISSGHTSATITWGGVSATNGRAFAIEFDASGSTPLASLDHWWSGALTATGGVVKVKTTNASSVRLKVANNAAMTASWRMTSAVTPDAQGWSAHTISDMAAGTTAYYQVETTDPTVTIQPQVHIIKSLPTAGTAASFSFTAASCFGHNSPGRNGIAFDGMRTKTSPLFAVITGDYGYYDPTSTAQADHVALYLDMISPGVFPQAATMLRDLPTYYVKSDHDSGPDANDPGVFTGPNRDAYKQVVPHPTLSDANGIYYSFLVGRVRFIFTDARYLRHPKAQTDNVSKSMLGATQKQWLKDRLVDTGALKVWIHEGEWVASGGWDADGSDPYSVSSDSWFRYTTERNEIGAYIVANGLSDRIFYLSGNGHNLSADDGTNNDAGGFATAIAAPGHRDVKYTGGPWSEGTYIRGGVEDQIAQQYGSVTITDSGSTITLLYQGWDALDSATPKISYSMVVGLQTSAVSLTASSTLTANATRIRRGVVPLAAVSTLSVIPVSSGLQDTNRTGTLYVRDGASWARVITPT